MGKMNDYKAVRKKLPWTCLEASSVNEPNASSSPLNRGAHSAPEAASMRLAEERSIPVLPFDCARLTAQLYEATKARKASGADSGPKVRMGSLVGVTLPLQAGPSEKGIQDLRLSWMGGGEDALKEDRVGAQPGHLDAVMGRGAPGGRDGPRRPARSARAQARQGLRASFQ